MDFACKRDVKTVMVGFPGSARLKRADSQRTTSQAGLTLIHAFHPIDEVDAGSLHFVVDPTKVR